MDICEKFLTTMKIGLCDKIHTYGENRQSDENQ